MRPHVNRAHCTALYPAGMHAISRDAQRCADIHDEPSAKYHLPQFKRFRTVSKLCQFMSVFFEVSLKRKRKMKTRHLFFAGLVLGAGMFANADDDFFLDGSYYTG